jgi:hypothetical protein
MLLLFSLFSDNISLIQPLGLGKLTFDKIPWRVQATMQKLFVCAAAVCALMIPAFAQRQPDGKGNLVRNPLPQFQRQPDAAVDATPTGYALTQDGIQYHGGPILYNTKNVYLIWYGNWSGNTATTILPALVTNLSGSPYFNINTTYKDNAGHTVSNSVALSGQANDSYSRGTSIGDADVLTIVSTAITNGLPKDTAGVYFVLTSSDVNETSGFCTAYCGWHDHGTISGSDIKYAFVGNPDRCPSACEAQTTVSPNGNTGADGMTSVIAHELEEAATDPDLNAWWQTSTGMENADKCAWKFGSEKTLTNGAKYNMTMNSVNYLIQMNWVDALRGTQKGYCSKSF